MATDSFTYLWRNASASVMRVIALHARHRSSEDREDLLQDVRIRAYLAFEGADRGRFTAWCCRIAYRICLDAMRRDSSRVTLLPVDEERGPTVLELAACERPNPLEVLLAEQAREELLTPFLGMTTAYREAVILRSEGLSYEEIGEIQGTTAGAVRARIHRLRAVAKGMEG